MAKNQKTEQSAPKRESLIKRAFRRYLIDAMSFMALGLFSSLIIGLILSKLAEIPVLNFLAPFAAKAQEGTVVGAAIGAAVAYGLKVKPLAIFSSIVTGALGYSLCTNGGGPVGAYLAAVVGAEIGNLIAGKTPVDILLVPIGSIVSGGLVATFVGPPIGSLMVNLGEFINTATQLHPIPMGIVVSTIVGLVLTAPISSAALCIMLELEGLAAGAACVGCCAQMIGFAVASYRENRIGGLISQGLGTSMLQFGNIMRRPIIWVPPTLTSAILGPISTSLFQMTNIPTGAGMGTSGLVGQFGAWTAMAEPFGAVPTLVLIAVMHFLLPAALTLLFSELFRKWGWIKYGDMKLAL